MLNLVQVLPEAVEHEGKKYLICTDFRIWIEFERVLFSDMEWREKAVRILSLCYVKELPEDLPLTLTLLLEFYIGGIKKENIASEQEQKSRVYDFFADAEMIYAAFLAQYNIDLTETNLHWWKFLALFRSLSENCKLMQVMHIRAVKLSSVRGSEQKNYYRRMKWLYRLPQEKTANDREPAEVLAGLI